MDKKLISEITRIGEMMGVKGSSLILESVACPFCLVIRGEVELLAKLVAKNEDIPLFKFKTNELLERVKNSEDLSINQKASLQNVINKLKEAESASDNVASFKTKVQDAIDNNEGLRDVTSSNANLIKSKIINVIDYSAIAKKPEFAKYFFDNYQDVVNLKNELKELINFPVKIDNIVNKYKTLDTYSDAIGNLFQSTLKEAGYDEPLLSNLVLLMKKFVKEEKNIVSIFGSKVSDNVVEPISVNSVIKRRRKVGLGNEPLEQRYADMYNDIIKKNGDELTNEEKLFMESVEKWKNGDDVDFEKVLNTKVGGPEVNTGGGTIESVVANWEKRTPGKGLARFSGVLIDVLAPISNLLRTVLGTLPSSIYLKQVERGINELVTRFEKDLSTAKIDPENMGGFKNQVRRILIDMQVAKTSDQTFEKLWIEMEKMIRDKSKQLGFDDVDEFIKLVKQGGTEGGAGTIENFLKITSDYANGITIWPWVNKTKLYKDFNFDKLGEYLPITKKWREFKSSFDEKVIKSSEGNKGIGGIIKGIANISSFLWEWFQGWLLYQAPKRLSVINNMLRNSGITGGRAITSIVGAYLGMVFISYFYEPFIDATIQLKERVKAQIGLETNETRGYPQLIADQYKNKFNDLLRGKIDWNPFGVGVIPAIVVSLGDNPKEVSNNQQEKFKKEIDDAQSKVNSEMDIRVLNTYNKMSDQEKQLAQNHYNTLKQMLSDSYNTYGLTKDQGKFIISRLEFTPTPSLDITNRINIIFDDMKKITDIKSLEKLSSKYQDTESVYKELPKVNKELPKVNKTDIVGNTFLKGKTNKYLVIKINEENQGEFPLGGKPIGYSYWIKPPYGKLSSGVKTTHYFKEFIEQYNNKLSSGVKTTHYFKEFIEQYNNL